jgi:Protein of unknown function (DUF3105)
VAKKPRTPPPPRKVQAPKQRHAPRQGLDAARRRQLLWGAGGVALVAVAVVLIVVLADSKDSSAGNPQAIAATMKAAGCTLSTSKAAPSGGHIATLDPSEKVTYTTYPAVSGKHYQIPAIWNNYTQEVDPRQVVHNEEHGGVIVWVGPGVSASERQQINDFYDESPNGMLVTPIANTATAVTYPKHARLEDLPHRLDRGGQGRQGQGHERDRDLSALRREGLRGVPRRERTDSAGDGTRTRTPPWGHLVLSQARLASFATPAALRIARSAAATGMASAAQRRRPEGEGLGRGSVRFPAGCAGDGIRTRFPAGRQGRQAVVPVDLDEAVVRRHGSEPLDEVEPALVPLGDEPVVLVVRFQPPELSQPPGLFLRLLTGGDPSTELCGETRGRRPESQESDRLGVAQRRRGGVGNMRTKAFVVWPEDVVVEDQLIDRTGQAAPQQPFWVHCGRLRHPETLTELFVGSQHLEEACLSDRSRSGHDGERPNRVAADDERLGSVRGRCGGCASGDGAATSLPA